MSDSQPISQSPKIQVAPGADIESWHVIELAEKQNGKKMWLCRCVCGTTKPVNANHLASRRSKNCGCVRKKTFNNRKHGKTKTPEYRIWRAIRERCYDPAHRGAKNYSQRGITVCRRWRDSFEDFIADMGQRPSKKHSIDRIDNDGGYWCGKCEECVGRGLDEANCRWATAVEQGNNRRDNHLIEFNGRTQTLQQWANETGIASVTIRHRLGVYGWTVERALTTPVDARETMTLTHKGRTMTFREWAAETGIGESALRQRVVAYGWSHERALTTPMRGQSL
jgi:hypothetical protein